MEPTPIAVELLPAFTNDRARCPECGARRPIRVHYDPGSAVRGCSKVIGGPHFHRICPNGHEWIER